MIKKLKYLDKTLLLVTLFLFIFGIIMVFSASNVTAYMSRQTSPYHYFLNQLLFYGIGFLLFTPIILSLKTKDIGKLSFFGILLMIGFLIYLLVSSKVRAINNANSWIDFGHFSLQPSEVVKVLSIFWLAHYYAINKKDLDKIPTIVFSLGICAIIALLITFQPDMGTAVIYTGIVVLMTLAAPLSKSIRFKFIVLIVGFVAIIGLALASGAVSKVLNDRQESRLTGYKNPCSKLLTTGNQVCNGYIAINNGGIDGVGLGKSTQKYLYLPEPYTDFIYAIIVEECGLVWGVTIILAYIIVLIRILVIGRNSKDTLGGLLCYGVALYIFIHIVINLGGVLGLIPITGVPLPFMSYGGSFTICLITSLAAVQKVAIESRIGG